MNNKWVQVWGQSHSRLSHFYYPSAEKTFRYVINSAVSGKEIRVELSNEYAENDVFIGEITVAVCDKNGNLTDEPKKLSVRGEYSFVLKRGEVLLSDSAEISVGIGDFFAVSIFVEKGDLRSGNLLNNLSLITVSGNVTETAVLSNERRKRDTVIEAAGKILNLWLHKPVPLIQSVQLLNAEDASSIIILGDSLSQQGFWTNRFEERIRKTYPGKYTVINKSIMGNRVLRDFSPRFPCKGLFGPKGKERFIRDVLRYPDCKYAVIELGTNDFLQYGSIAAPKSEKPTPEAVFEGIKYIYDRLTENGIRTIIVNTVKFGDCIDSRPEKERMAQQYNEILEENRGLFYGVYDWASILQNENKPNCTRIEYLGKDKLHFNTVGGNTAADNFPLELFE